MTVELKGGDVERRPPTRGERKRADIDIAARAEYEATKDAVLDLEATTWDTLPETRHDQLPGPDCKEYYRWQVSTGIEALWRAGRLS